MANNFNPYERGAISSGDVCGRFWPSAD